MSDSDFPAPPPPVPGQGAPSGSNGIGIASLVLGIISLPLVCIWYISIPCAILAVIFGIVGRKRTVGRGLATAGLICGAIALALYVVLMILALACGVAAVSMFGPEFTEAIEEAARQATEGTTTAPASDVP